MNFALIAVAALICLGACAYTHYRYKGGSQRQADQATLQTIIDHLPFALFAKDAATGYAYKVVNRAAERAFCLNRSDMIGLRDHELFPPVEAAFFRRIDTEVMAGGKLVDIDAETVSTPKGFFTAHTIKVPIYDARGKPELLLGIFEDITEKAKTAERLLQAKDRAEQADRAKSEFLANMSHELRTPLNSIMGMTRLLQESAVDDEQRMLAQTVLSSSATLLEIVNDILDLSKIEAGSMKLEQIGFDLNYIHRSLIDRLNPLAIEKKLPPLNLKESRPPFVRGDPLRLTRVLTNLISNAIKYSDSGEITITASHSFPTPQNLFYRCEVADRGIGIPIDQRERIFDKFTQGDASTTRRYGGTGLGLAITRQLVELMGGGIGFSSETGKGSVFWIEIPFAISDHVHREKAGNRQLAKYSSLNPAAARVLVVEDDRINQVFIQKLLEKFHITHYRLAENGLAAVECFRQQEWDLILMDCHMPEMNGYEAANAIRAFERVNGGHVPIIAMTANAMVGDREKCLRYGMDDYVSKPIMFEEIAKVLSQWINPEAPSVS